MNRSQGLSDFVEQVLELPAQPSAGEWERVLQCAGSCLGADRAYLVRNGAETPWQWCAEGREARGWNGAQPEMALAQGGVYSEPGRLLVPLEKEEVLLGVVGFDWLGGADSGALTDQARALGHLLSHALATRAEPDKFRDQHWRLASLGLFAGALAHEINTPLFFIEANLDFLAQSLDAFDPENQETLEEIRAMVRDSKTGAASLREVVTDLRQITRPDTAADPVAVELPKVLETVGRVARREIKHHATVRTDLGDLPPVLGREALISQVFLNLIMNAYQALPRYQPEQSRIDVRGETDGEFVRVDVTDNGHGMSEETLARVFEPFFTTRGGEGGTGLGLALCRRLVTMMRGRIDIASAEGEGTTVSVRLPRADKD